MRTLGCALLLLMAGEDPRRGIELLAAGKPAQAAELFAAALLERPDDAELHYNHALALWRAGQPEAAEAAAERAAALSDGRLAALRDGILGNLRYEKSVAAEQQVPPDLEQALALAEAARAHFERGALRPGAPPELGRNLERALARIEELKQKQREQKQEQKQPPQQQPQQDPQQQEQQQQRRQEQQQEQRPQEQKQEQGRQEQQQQQEQGRQEQPQQQERDQPDAPTQTPPPAPGEHLEGKELSPEQRQRLLELLEQLDAARERMRAAQRVRRPGVERDW